MKSALLFSFILIVSSSYSQSPFSGEINWGEPQNGKLFTIPDPIGFVGNELFVTHQNRTKYWLESYDVKSLKCNSSEKIKFEYKDNNLDKTAEFVVGDNLVFITTFRNKSKKKDNYFIQKYSGNGVLSDPRPIADIDYSGVPNFGVSKLGVNKAAQGRNAFKVVQSKDQKLILALYTKVILSEGAQTWVAKLFNTSLEEIWSYEFVVPEKDKMFIDQIKVTNEGVAYAMGMINFDVKFNRWDYGAIGEELYSFVSDSQYFLKIDGANSEVVVSEIVTPTDQDVASASLDLVDGGVMFYGMLGDKEKSLVTGTFFVKMDFNGNQLFSSKEDFDIDFITQHMSERQKEKVNKKEDRTGKKPEMYRYILRDLLQKENGEVILTAEQYYVYTRTTTTRSSVGIGPGASTSTTTTTVIHYVYNDVIVVNCDKNGTILWKSLVKKRQNTTDDGGYYSSFFGVVSADNLYLIFNDSEFDVNEEEFEDAKLMEKMRAKRNTVASFVAFDNSGEQTHEILFDFPDDKRRQLVPKVCGKVSENEFFLFTRTKNNMTILGVVTL